MPANVASRTLLCIKKLRSNLIIYWLLKVTVASYSCSILSSIPHDTKITNMTTDIRDLFNCFYRLCLEYLGVAENNKITKNINI